MVWFSSLTYAQTFPVQNLQVNGTSSFTGVATFTIPIGISSGGTNSGTASGTSLDNITGFSGTGFLTRTGAGAYSFQSLTNGISFSNLPQVSANTVLGNFTGSTANLASFSIPSCSGATNALLYTSGTGLSCNSAINAATLGGATFASPGNIGTTTPAQGAFTSLGLTGPTIIGSNTPLTPCDNTGVTDATSCLNTLVQAAENITGGNGVLIIPPGNYKVSGTIFQSKPSTVIADGVTLTWGTTAPGSCCTPVYEVGNPSATNISQVIGINLSGLTVNLNSINNLYGIEWNTVRNSQFENLTVNNGAGTVQGGAGPFAYYVTSTDTGTIVNTSLNTFVNLNGLSNWQGVALSGVGSGGNPTATATDNGFFGIHMFFLASEGIDLIQYADTNRFWDVGVYASNSSGSFYGVVFNDGASSSSANNDILWETFDGLTVTGGSGGTAVGLLLNYTYGNIVNGFMFTSAGASAVNYSINGPTSVVSLQLNYQNVPFISQYIGPPPTAVAGANAGSGAPSPQVQGGSNAVAGTVCFGTGSGPASGSVLTVTYPSGLSSGSVPKVTITPLNGLSWALQPVASSITTTSFNVFATATPTASESANCSGYVINYVVTP